MYFKFNDINIYYEKYGISKQTILILPGWGNTRETFKNIINNLKENYTIYILDYPSFGKSSIPKVTLSIYDYALLIKAFITSNNIKSPHIIAHSFGGRITSLLIGYYKIDVKKVILIDVAGIKRRKNINSYLKEKIYKLLKKLTFLLPTKKRIIYQRKLFYNFASKDYQNINTKMQQTFKNIINEDLRKYYKEISNETLLIWGEKDIDTPYKDALLLNRIIKNSALITYKNSYHFPYLDYQNNIINVIKYFLK